ncbi:MAG: urease accessory protein UreF [Povalibacter sp.]
MSPLLHILHLASPALPIGGFHFSQGLEQSVECGWVRDEKTALEWIGGIAAGALGSLDLPVLARLHEGCSTANDSFVSRWDALLIASRETEELRAEDRHLGAALIKVLREIAPDLQVAAPQTYAAGFARACVHWNVPALETLQAYAWSWAENQVLAAVKLVPLGQSSGQRILHALIPQLQRLSAEALGKKDSDIGYSGVMQAVASARHEFQYTRLFRS